MAASQQEDDPESMLAFYRRMLAWRKARPALARGSFAIGETTDSLISYVRADGDDAVFCAFNLGADPVVAALPEGEWRDIADSGFAGRIVGRTVELPPHQALFAAREQIGG
jgi:alpha-glucosidase